MSRFVGIINLNKTSAAELTCQFLSGHTTPDLDQATQLC